MKKLSCFLVAMLFLLMPALQSCDDNDGYSIGQLVVAGLQFVF